MPRIPFESKTIELVVSDRIIQETIFKQKATFVSLTHEQRNGECKATITVVVDLYASNNGEFGEKLTGRGISSYEVVMTAANDTIVSVLPEEEGKILFIRSNESDLMWNSLIDSTPGPVLPQGDLFEMLRERPIRIADLIRHHIANADALGRFTL